MVPFKSPDMLCTCVFYAIKFEKNAPVALVKTKSLSKVCVPKVEYKLTTKYVRICTL